MPESLKRTNDILDEVFTVVFGPDWEKGRQDCARPQITSVTIRDKTYPSVKIAAEEMGLTTMAVYAARSGGYLDRVGLRKQQTAAHAAYKE